MDYLIFMVFELVTIILFLIAFFTKQPVIWAMTAVFSGIMMVTSYTISYYMYEFNTTLMAYVPVVQTFDYPYLMGINLLFFVLCWVFGLFDIFDTYRKNIKKEIGVEND